VRWQYAKGLQDLGGGSFAWLQPDGSWGWSNAGLVTDGEASLLVDTLFDLGLTGEMLAAMRDASPAAHAIDVLVNTHANGDHCFGNELVEGAVIVASTACAEEMGEVPPAMLAALVQNADELGAGGAFFREVFGAFHFDGIALTPPTETFEGRQMRRVGDKDVELIEVGPAHTRGDVLVHVGNWIRACDTIISLEPEIVVPGHGPITDVAGVRTLRDYLSYIEREARRRYEAGLGVAEAARDISLADYASWGDAERIVVNVATLYREFGAPGEPPNPVELFAMMGELARERAGA
jgi:glyoxylase-like metal-dependent hydrolase (beta-lactamase superfamily II)